MILRRFAEPRPAGDACLLTDLTMVNAPLARVRADAWLPKHLANYLPDARPRRRIDPVLSPAAGTVVLAHREARAGLRCAYFDRGGQWEAGYLPIEALEDIQNEETAITPDFLAGAWAVAQKRGQPLEEAPVWLRFQGRNVEGAVYLEYDDEQLGTRYHDDATFVGKLHLHDDHAIAMDAPSLHDGCTLLLQRRGPFLMVGDNDRCGSMRMNFVGLYLRQPAAPLPTPEPDGCAAAGVCALKPAWPLETAELPQGPVPGAKLCEVALASQRMVATQDARPTCKLHKLQGGALAHLTLTSMGTTVELLVARSGAKYRFLASLSIASEGAGNRSEWMDGFAVEELARRPQRVVAIDYTWQFTDWDLGHGLYSESRERRRLLCADGQVMLRCQVAVAQSTQGGEYAVVEGPPNPSNWHYQKGTARREWSDERAYHFRPDGSLCVWRIDPNPSEPQDPCRVWTGSL